MCGVGDNIGMSEIELHRKLLGDRARNKALHTALKRVISPGKSTVVDIGAGTGFISFLARQLGAKHCTLIEYSDTLLLARELARVNKIDGLSFVQAHSGEVEKPTKADVVVSETLGNYALEEGLLETLVDARRFLAPGGTLMPCGLQQFIAPVLSSRLLREIDVWPQVGFDLNLGPARETALNNMYVKTLKPSDLGGSAKHVREWDRLSFGAGPDDEQASSLRRATLEWGGLSAKTVYGFALWWRAELIPGVAISTSPFEAPTHWEQVYLPLLEPLRLQKSDTLELELLSDTRPEAGLQVAWHTTLHRKGKAVHSQQQDIGKGRI